MGRASREKWIKRAEVLERAVLRGNPDLSKAYLDRFGKKLPMVVRGAQQLAAEREMDAQEEDDEDEPQD